jgi:hypothetical protein
VHQELIALRALKQCCLQRIDGRHGRLGAHHLYVHGESSQACIRAGPSCPQQPLWLQEQLGRRNRPRYRDVTLTERSVLPRGSSGSTCCVASRTAGDHAAAPHTGSYSPPGERPS